MNPVRSNNLSLKYHRFTPSGCTYIRIRKSEFVAKTQFFLLNYFLYVVYRHNTELSQGLRKQQTRNHVLEQNLENEIRNKKDAHSIATSAERKVKLGGQGLFTFF